MKIALQRRQREWEFRRKYILLYYLSFESRRFEQYVLLYHKQNSTDGKWEKKQTYSFLAKRLLEQFGSIDMLKILILVWLIRAKSKSASLRECLFSKETSLRVLQNKNALDDLAKLLIYTELGFIVLDKNLTRKCPKLWKLYKLLEKVVLIVSILVEKNFIQKARKHFEPICSALQKAFCAIKIIVSNNILSKKGSIGCLVISRPNQFVSSKQYRKRQ